MKIIKPLLACALLLIVIVSAGCISGTTETTGHSDFVKLGDHFYTVTYYDYDESAMKTCAEYMNLVPKFGCSAVSAAGYLSHNYDFFYSDAPEILIRIPATENRYASISMGTWLATLTCAEVENGLDPVTASMLPYTIVDGINEKGLAVAINVVPARDTGFTTGTNPGAKQVPYMCIPRLVLDKCATAKEAVEYMQKIDIYNPEKEFAELHYMFADEKETYLVEIINNTLHVTKEKPFMTNYYLTIGNYTPHSMGIERYNIIKENYDSIKSFDDMKRVMQMVKYSRKYDRSTNPFWYSEYAVDKKADGTILDIYSPEEDYQTAIENEIKNYKLNKRDLNLDVWKTLHTAIYDLKNKTLKIYLNEDYDTEYRFIISGK